MSSIKWFDALATTSIFLWRAKELSKKFLTSDSNNFRIPEIWVCKQTFVSFSYFAKISWRSFERPQSGETYLVRFWDWLWILSLFFLSTRSIRVFYWDSWAFIREATSNPVWEILLHVSAKNCKIEFILEFKILNCLSSSASGFGCDYLVDSNENKSSNRLLHNTKKCWRYSWNMNRSCNGWRRWW